MRSPYDEDGTPPELRSGCGQPSFVQPDQNGHANGEGGGFASKVTSGMISHGGKSGQPFFNGKLILREVTNNNGCGIERKSSSSAHHKSSEGGGVGHNQHHRNGGPGSLKAGPTVVG